MGQLLATSDIASADFVVFAGGSAGGIGVFNNVDFVQTSLPNVPVLGMFILRVLRVNTTR
jgi:hypothetical protein